ncbi:sugar porter (SP) family MFS transporter [Catalinimonas alkaloidigena]|uniref:sugar porter family MFS transporter n=1 Tax=Catalinimonas alkaloidigena TaxID=1075417 RepID=UPI0024049AED|nr:sugar porter family MFS transporter [Catalinimonas alkaloidigena]MDF9794914.1 sugar porter (SP) family MFS transporter [Catalinimonas alkaloidigena]
MKENIKYNQTYLWLISMTAAMGGFLFGYDWVVIGGAKPYYEPFFNLNTPALQGWGTSSALVGCMVGAIACVFLSDKYGRKRLLIFAGFLFSLSAIGTALASDFSWFNIYRIIGGVAMGIALNLSPMYISEISPPEKRGMFVTINQLLVMIGVLMAQLVNWRISLLDTALPVDATNEVIAQSWSGQAGWRWMFGAEVLPAFLFFVLMFFVPESVRWLVKNGQEESALRVLNRIGGSEYAQYQVKEVKRTISKEDVSHVNFKQLLNSRVLKFIGLGVFLAFLQQWSGLNVIIYYASDIFQAAGYNLKQMMLNIVVIGTVMVLSVVVTMATVDKLGRKTLLLFGTFSMAITYALIGYCFYANYEGFLIVLLVLANVMFYSITLAPLLWVVLSEIFPNRIRGAAMSIAAFAHWLGNFTLTFSFPTIKENLGWANNFWLYGVICAIGFVVLYYILPETKGKSLEEIEHELIDGSPKKEEVLQSAIND